MQRNWSGPAWGRGTQMGDFQELMRRRVEDILLVSSPYDWFILEEDGHLHERILGEFLDLGLRNTPGLTRASTGSEAIRRAIEDPRFNLIITSLQLGDMNAVELARQIKAHNLDVPVVLLAADARELKDFLSRHDVRDIDRAFLWQGDVRILLAIIKYVEDKLNVAFDSGICGVPAVLVVEDSVRYYSSFLPIIYGELMHHSHGLVSEGVNLAHKILRIRARPKLLLASTFEEAWEYFEAYQDNLLGCISDIEFPRSARPLATAGAELAERIRQVAPDIPIILHSSRRENESLAENVGAAFFLKGSPTLLSDLRRYMVDYFAFGDFVFRTGDAREVGRARDLRTLEELLHTVPVESIAYHGERNHFSKWLRARAEFALAHRLRPRRVSDYPSFEDLRADLIASIAEYRHSLSAGIIADFERRTFDATGGFHRLGGGSLGGKARGLAFVRRLLADFDISASFPDVAIAVPDTVVVATDVFDRFLDDNNLRDFAINSDDEAEIQQRILDAPLPLPVQSDLAAYLMQVDYPLAVRSSSLLEDSQYQPLTGVYETFMLANNHPDPRVRLEQLMRAIKGVYASLFTHAAKAYFKATPYRLEEEKMAVILQKILGSTHEERFYPDFSGVARSYDFYPVAPLSSEDGVVAVALGLGGTVVSGGPCMRFCPRHPRHVMQFSSVKDTLANSQREFLALELQSGHLGMDPGQEMREKIYPLAAAETDGTLAAVGSTYSPENDAVYDGIGRKGIRLVSFAPILKHNLFPLCKILNTLMEIGMEGMGGPVEIEFAVNLQVPAGQRAEFGFLQMRPLALSREKEELTVAGLPDEQLLCRCSNVLGNGRITDIWDLVVVDADRFDRSRSLEAAAEVAQLNAELTASHTPYILIGPGRWGSTDPWLGIPVKWGQIGGVRVIVEATFRDLKVTPSQGSHFFQNLTSFQVGYFSVTQPADGFVDWAWLAAQRAVFEGQFVRRIHLDAPVEVRMSGKTREGILIKPSGHAAIS